MNDDLKDRVKAAVGIADLFRDAGCELKPVKQGEYVCLCPFHNEKTPSCRVHDEGFFRCFGCGKAGDVFEFVQKQKQCDFADALKLLSERTGIKNTPLTLSEYAFAKKLPLELLQSLSCRNTEKGLIIPYFDIGMKPMRARVRKAMKGDRFTWLITSQAAQLPIIPYGVWCLELDSEALFLVEGESDTHSAMVHKLNCLGIPGAQSSKHLQLVHMRGAKAVYVVQEPGDAGKAFVDGIGARLREIGYKGEKYAINLGEHKDMSAMHMALEYDDFGAAIVQRLETRTPIFDEAAPAESLLEQIQDDIAGRRMSVAFPDCPTLSLTQCCLPGDIIMVCGGAGSSKTWLTTEWAYKLLLNENVPCAMLELEKQENFHTRRIFAMWSRESWITNAAACKARPDETLRLFREFQPVLEKIQKQGLISLCNEAPTKTWILTWLQKACERGCRMIVIDPISMMQKDPESRMLLDDENAFVERAAKIVGKYKATLILVSHPTKDFKSDCKPHESFIKGSTTFMRATDTVFWLQVHVNTKGDFYPLGQDGKPNKFDLPIKEWHNRTMWVLKKRQAGLYSDQIAFDFCGKTLSHIERGFIE